jgi:hypothetical protein
VPYRVDVARASDAVLDRLVELGAVDVDRLPGAGVAALMPDAVAPEQVPRAQVGRIENPNTSGD